MGIKDYLANRVKQTVIGLKQALIEEKDALKHSAGWLTGSYNKQLNAFFSTAKQEEIFQKYLASANLKDVDSALKQFKEVPKEFFSARAKDVASLFPKDQKIAGTADAFFDKLSNKPEDTAEQKKLKEDLNKALFESEAGRSEEKITAKIASPGNPPAEIPMRDFLNKEIDDLSSQVKHIDALKPLNDPRVVDPLAQEDFLGNLRGRLNVIRSKELKGIQAEHAEEIKRLENLFKDENPPELREKVAAHLGIDTKILKEELTNALKAAHQNELKQFEDSFTKQRNELEKILSMEMYRLTILKFVEEHGSESEKKTLEGLVKKAADARNQELGNLGHLGISPGTNYDFKGVNPQSLGAFNFFNIKMDYNQGTGLHSVVLTKHVAERRHAMNLLVKNIRSSSKGEDISLTLNMNDPKKAESEARELYLACIRNGYDRGKIHITSNGKNMTAPNKEGKIEIFSNSSTFDTEVKNERSNYLKRTGQARTAPLTHMEDTERMANRHRRP